MTPEVLALRSRSNYSEEDLQLVVSSRSQCLREGKRKELAQCDLLLSQLVKWVRSDTEEPWYVRATELIDEAVAICREIEDKTLLAEALTYSVPFVVPNHTEERLREAFALAEELNDELLLARALRTQGHQLSIFDEAESNAMLHKALDIYRRHGHDRGVALCLESLTIGAEGLAKLEYGLESAAMFRKSGDHQAAARRMLMVALFCRSITTLDQQKAFALQTMADAQASLDLVSEAAAYSSLTRITRAQGNHREAKLYRRWKKEMRELLGLNEDLDDPAWKPRIIPKECLITEKPDDPTP